MRAISKSGGALAIAWVFICAAQAQVARPESSDPGPRYGGKLLATGGVSQVDGAGGGGLPVWALVGGYGTDGQFGANAHYTMAQTGDYRLETWGATASASDRIELSATKQRFDTRDIGARLGLGRGYAFRQEIYGAKLRVLGSAVYDQDRWWPQVSVGAQYKRSGNREPLAALGAARSSGTDWYVAASKLYLDRSVLVNAAVRYTDANQLGLLGFGGPGRDRLRAQFEGGAALLLRRDVAVGVEARTKRDALGLGEQTGYDAFAAWFPRKAVSLTIAYVDLGKIVVPGRQQGGYASLQIGF